MRNTDLLSPRVVAVAGASAVPGKLGNTILQNIIDCGFSGVLYPVNPRGGTILGFEAFTSIRDLPEVPDLCVIVTPAATVPDIVAECGESGVPLAVIISGGFAERGPEGEAIQEDVLARARSGGVRIIGPNCQGLNLPHLPLCASWPLLSRAGKIAIVSQSGTIGAELMDRLQSDGLGFSGFVSLGNRSDLDEADFISYFEDHAHTEATALYIEGIRDGQRFRRAVESAGKPIIILKAGRTAEGRTAISSHTRSLAGSYEISRGFFRQTGVIIADSIDDLYHFSRAAAYLNPPRGRRLLILTSSGGSGVMAVDRAVELGFDLVGPTDEKKAILRRFIPENAIIGNPLDFTGDATAEHYRKVISLLEEDYDYSMAILGDPIPGAAESLTGFGKLIIVCLGGGDLLREESGKLARTGIPVFPDPGKALECLAALDDFAKRRGTNPHE